MSKVFSAIHGFIQKQPPISNGFAYTLCGIVVACYLGLMITLIH